jgi:hypothetical protein
MRGWIIRHAYTAPGGQRSGCKPVHCLGFHSRPRASSLFQRRLRYLTIHRIRQSDIVRSMPVSVHPLEQAHTQVRAAIVHRRPITALYRGRRRLLCPHLLGWSRHRRLQVLCATSMEVTAKAASSPRAHRITGAAWPLAHRRKSLPDPNMHRRSRTGCGCLPSKRSPCPSPNPKSAKLQAREW